MWVKGAPILSAETKDEYVSYIDSVVKACLPDEESDPELYDLVNKYQIHSHSATCGKYKNIPCRFGFSRFFTERTICAEPLHSDMDEIEKEHILSHRYQILSKVKKYIDEFLNPHKPNFNGDHNSHFLRYP